ncbi:hypothetical protein [Amycolatopsis sp. lyj-23]|uniref:hypothetical protein n=1 Tax=Amycolatopsis sp. lyj-23 TaxID=2789283 RepID=UPI00397C9C0A
MNTKITTHPALLASLFRCLPHILSPLFFPAAFAALRLLLAEKPRRAGVIDTRPHHGFCAPRRAPRDAAPHAGDRRHATAADRKPADSARTAHLQERFGFC